MLTTNYYNDFFEFGQQKINFSFFELSLPDDDPVYTLKKVMEELDFSGLLANCSDKGRTGYNPIMMYAVVTYANMRGIRSVDRIVDLCERDLAFIWLTRGQKPKRDAFYDFKNRKLTSDVLDDLNYQFMRRLQKEGLVTLKELFIDGTKIEANANRYTFVWRGSINYHLAGLLDSIDQLFEKYNSFLQENDYGTKYELGNAQMFVIEGMDKVREVIFKTPYSGGGKTYVLNEVYGYGYVKNELYLDNRQVPLTTLQITNSLEDVTFDKSVMLAVPMMFYKSAKYEGRGGSIFDVKVDSYDALDEVWSQWMDALRAGRAKTYIPDCLVPRDPETGAAITPNPFDNRYFAAEGDQREGQKNVISTDQPSIPHDSYQASYCTALDLCLQGIISPSTLGIDVKKLDNAEAQREKEKTTLYTRNIIVETLQTVLPQVVSMCINAYHLMKNEAVESVEVNLPFGEYANPSFESQVETVGKAKQSGIMSIERCVEELYGDSLDDNCKKEEIARLKAEQGIQSIPEPEIRTDAGEFRINGFTGGSDGSKSSKKNIPDEPGGVPGATEGGQ